MSSRIPAVQPESSTGKAKEIFEGPLKGKHFNIFRSMAASPAVLEAYLGMSGALNGTTLSAKEREVIQLAVGEANRCEYCVAAHTMIGKGAGLTEDATVEARRGKLIDPRLNALARFALAIHEKKGAIAEKDAQDFVSAGFTQAQMGEVVAVYSLAVFTNYFNHVNQTPLDFPAPPAL